MAIFGYNTIGGTTGGLFSGGSFIGSNFQAPEDGVISLIEIYCQCPFTGTTDPIHTALFNQLTLNLLANSSTPGGVGTSWDWYGAALSYHMSQGEPLFASGWIDGAYNIRNYSGLTNQSFEKYNQTFPNWPSTINNSVDFNSFNTQISIRITYTPDSNPDQKITVTYLAGTVLGSHILGSPDPATLVSTNSPFGYLGGAYLAGKLLEAGSANANVNAGVSSVAINVISPTVQGSANVNAGVSSVVINVISPTVSVSANISAGVSSIELNVISPTVSSGSGFNADVSVIELNAIQPTVTASANVSVSVSSVAINVISPSIQASANVNAGISSISINVQSPVVFGEANFSSDVSSINLTLIAPSVIGNSNINAGLSVINLVQIAPGILGYANIEAGVSEIELNLIAPSVTVSTIQYWGYTRYWNGSAFVRGIIRLYKNGRWTRPQIKILKDGEWKYIEN